MFRISLRSMLFLVALMALAIVSLRYATEGWLSAVGTISLVAFSLLAIIAAVDRGPRQAFAVGFVLSMSAYGLALLSGGSLWDTSIQANRELNPATGRLPTSRALLPVYEWTADIRYVNFQTGAIATPAEVQRLASHGGSNYSLTESPARETFMAIGHCWWALLLGWLGGCFAKWIYVQRMREVGSLASGRG